MSLPMTVGLELDDLKGPFQPKPLYNSMLNRAAPGEQSNSWLIVIETVTNTFFIFRKNIFANILLSAWVERVRKSN